MKRTRRNPTDIQKTLGRNLVELRRKRGLSQEEVRDLTGVSQQYLSELEGGRRNPSIAMVDKVAKALGVEIIDLLGPKPPPSGEG